MFSEVQGRGNRGAWNEGRGAADIDCKVVHRRSSSDEDKRSLVVKPLSYKSNLIVL